MRKYLLLFSLFFTLSSIGGLVFQTYIYGTKSILNNAVLKENSSVGSAEVLGSSYRRVPQIYISNVKDGYSSGGVVALSSTDEPSVGVWGYDISGTLETRVYKAQESDLLDYLTHDSDWKQTKRSPDVKKLDFVTTISQQVDRETINDLRILLPLEETGIWFLKVKLGEVEADAFVVRSNTGVLVKEGDDKFIFWGQDYKTKRSVPEGEVKIFNLLKEPKVLQKFALNDKGIAEARIDAEADIAIFKRGDDKALVPINLKYLNTGYNSWQFKPKNKETKYFIFTDRPLYKPGDTVYFKTVLRDDDDARYTIPSGNAMVKVTQGWQNEDSIFQKSFPISADGTINGQFKLSEDAKVGYYNLFINPNRDGGNYSNNMTFNVQYYRKPEFSIEVSSLLNEVVSGDKVSFKISGQYFSGQPLFNQKVKYAVYSSDFYEYSYLVDKQSLSDDYRYGYWDGSNKIYEGTAVLNKNGEIVIDLNTKLNSDGKSQVFSIEATIDDGSQNPAFSRKNILVYAGEYGIYRKEFSYGAKVNTPIKLPVALMIRKGVGNVSGVSLTARVHRENWYAVQNENEKYPTYKKEEEDLAPLTALTDNKGEAEFKFIPLKTGSYRLTVEGKDSRGNLVSNTFYYYISEEGQPYYDNEGKQDLTLSLDKTKYLPTDIVKLNVASIIPNRDIFLSLERGRVNRYQILNLTGSSASVDLPLESTDIPNIYASVSSFSDNDFESTYTNISVSTDSKKLVVTLTPESKLYGPGETAKINISTTDLGGNPISADLALWVVDKSIFELSTNNLGNIFETYWSERNNSTNDAHSLEGIMVYQGGMGGCFAAGTGILMSDGSTKSIENVKAGEFVLTRFAGGPGLVKAKVLSVHKTEVDGYMIINGHLKVTPNHIMWVNDFWKEAGSIQTGDFLTDKGGKKVLVTSVEWQRGKFAVYNFQVEKYHTYFANGVLVHNEKGIARDTFDDTAYWNPSIKTDSSGRAQVAFVLPDNLTTWTVASVGSTASTRVGQATSEIVVNKDFVIRPIIPNILREGDDVVLSALFQNFTLADQSFDIELKFDSGKVEKPVRTDFLIKSNSTEQLYWKVRPSSPNANAKFTFDMISKSDPKLGDIVIQEVPVLAFGFMEKRAETGENDKSYFVKLEKDSKSEKSKVILSLSPTILGTLPSAMRYLVEYPYGCIEQTISRFAPAVIAKLNQDEFSQALKDKNLDDIIKKGISRISDFQQYDGGWTWWFTGASDPFITSHVVEYLLQAKKAGAGVGSEMLNKAQSYLERPSFYNFRLNQEQNYSREAVVVKTYALTLLGSENRNKNLTDFDGLSPDVLSFAVMSNYLNGNKNPQTNGLLKLISMVKTQGDGAFWDEGEKLNFGSKDASTALAVRAILLADDGKANIEFASKGVRYLMRNRKFDYWSNTYATTQVVRALTEYSKAVKETSPNYTYSVKLDGQEISQGSITDSKQVVKDIEIPISKLQTGESTVSVSKTGVGQLYSTLLINEFHTNKNTKALNHGILVEREYVNEKGSQYSIGVGDTVIVKIKVSGLGAPENYGVIDDELPSGLIPINQTFLNEQFGQNNYDFYGITDREVTQNGIILSLYEMVEGQRVYTYKARAINAGKFVTPPAVVSLMYAPEIYGRSDVQTIEINKKSEILPGKALQYNIRKLTINKNASIVYIFLVTVLAVFMFMLIKRRHRKTSSPTSPDQQSATQS